MNKKNIKNKKIILAYSGGLDTSVILHWLKAHGYDVICLVVDIGQQENFEAIKAKAYRTGASNVFVKDLKQEFIEDYIFQALKANATYEGSYLLGTSIARPLIAKAQIALAKEENTIYLAHGATGKGNDQVRFELTYYSLMPEAQVIAPWRDPEFLAKFKGRDDLIAYAKKNKIPVEATLVKPYSIDENLMHTSFEAGMIEDLSYIVDESIFKKTRIAEKIPNKPTILTIDFKQGIPQQVFNHEIKEKVSGSLALFEYLNKLGGLYAIGRVDMVENRFVGIKSRGIYEAPGAAILWKAHKDLESLTLDREVAHIKEYLGLKISSLIYNGFWESPEMKFLMTAINESQKYVSGEITVKLSAYNVCVIERKSDYSLYNSKLSSMHQLGDYNQIDAQGFIKIQALRLKQSAQQSKNKLINITLELENKVRG